MDARQALRKQMREARKSLSHTEQHQAGQSLLEQLKPQRYFQQAQRIAIYLSADGEINTSELIHWCWLHNKDVYLPVLDPDKHNSLLFVHYTSKTRMTHNKYQIEEPATPYQDLLPADQLDLVLLPLVSFDETGNRMGMGGGYYDRTFSFKQNRGRNSKPLLVGLAHEVQKVESLPVESWDIPLAGIATNDKVYSAESN